MGQQRLFHFFGRHHFAAALDEILGAASQIDVAIIILIAQVAGVNPAGTQRLPGGGFFLPVAGHHPGAARHDFAGFAQRHRLPGLVHDGHFHIFQRLADGTQAAQLALDFLRAALQQMVFRRQHGDGRGGFGLPESVDETGAGQPGDGLADYFRRHRRRAVGNHLQTGQIEVAELRVVQQLFQHRRHQHGPVDGVLLHQRQPQQRLELAHDHLGAAGVHGGQRRLQPGDMVVRHRHQIGLFQIGVGRGNGGKDVGSKAVVGEHYAFGEVGGAGGEHNDGGVGGVGLREVELLRGGCPQQMFVAGEAGGGAGVQDNHPVLRHPEEVFFPQQLQIALADEQAGWAGDVQHLVQFVGLGAEVEGDIDGVKLGGGEVDFDAAVAVHLHHRHPVAGMHAQLGQRIGQPVDALGELFVVEFPPVEDDRRAVGDDGAGDGQQFGGVHYSFRSGFVSFRRKAPCPYQWPVWGRPAPLGWRELG